MRAGEQVHLFALFDSYRSLEAHAQEVKSQLRSCRKYL